MKNSKAATATANDLDQYDDMGDPEMTGESVPEIMNKDYIKTDRSDNHNQLADDGLSVIFRSKKAGKNLPVDLMALPWASMIAVVQYGAQRFINDKLGGSDIDTETASKLFDEIMDKLEAGWDSRSGGGTPGANPIEAKALSLATAQIKNAIMVKGLKLKDVGKVRVDSLAQDLLAKNNKAFMVEAKKLLEAEKSAADLLGDFDLGSLTE